MTARVLGVHSIDHYALFVPSIDEARTFFTTFGLDVRDAGTGLELRAGDGHVWARMLPGDAKSLAYISFNCFEDDLAGLRQQVEQAGARFEKSDGVGFWFKDPDGNLLQIKAGEKTMPDQRVVTPASASGARGAVTRAEVEQVRPHRLSHLMLFTPSVSGQVDFYQCALGLRLSDRSADIVAFTHAQHGCDHHLVAFCTSGAKGFHHASWEVASIDEVGNGAEQMKVAGYTDGWGTGRHCLGSNYFHYVRDPWGSFNEYSAEMDYIGAGTEWSAGDFAPENSLYLWGPGVPEYFILNTEVSVPITTPH